jgi:hypothetical protein
MNIEFTMTLTATVNLRRSITIDEKLKLFTALSHVDWTVVEGRQTSAAYQVVLKKDFRHCKHGMELRNELRELMKPYETTGN